MTDERTEPLPVDSITLDLKPGEQVAVFIRRQSNNRVTVNVKPSRKNMVDSRYNGDNMLERDIDSN